jgi:hypothetical protein
VIGLIPRTTKEPRRNHVIGCRARHSRIAAVCRSRSKGTRSVPVSSMSPASTKGRNDMPVPIDVLIELCARWPMPHIQARADLARYGFDVAPMHHHTRQINREHPAQPRHSTATSSAPARPACGPDKRFDWRSAPVAPGCSMRPSPDCWCLKPRRWRSGAGRRRVGAGCADAAAGEQRLRSAEPRCGRGRHQHSDRISPSRPASTTQTAVVALCTSSSMRLICSPTARLQC